MRVPTTVLVLLGLAVGQQKKDDILGVQEWWGQISIKASHVGSTASERWDLQESLNQSVHLDTAVNAPWFLPANRQEALDTGRWGGWFNTKPGSLFQVFKIRELSVRGDPADRHITQRWSGVDAGRGAEGLFQFQIDLRRGVYTFTVPGPVFLRPAPLHHDSVDVIPGFPTIRQDLPGTIECHGRWGEGGKLPDQKLPAQGLVLKGSIKLLYETPYSNRGGPPGEAVLDWTFAPKPPPPLELEIEATPDGPLDYAHWRPRPGPDERTPGSFVNVTARVKTPPGSQPEEVSVIRLILTDVSEERGVSLNYPPGAETGDPVPDFAFDPFYNRNVIVNDRRAHVVGPQRQIDARIAFFDGGAWGELMAEAEMVSGRYVLGHVKGKPAQQTLLIPERRPDSKIADIWRSPGADDADGDDRPAGDQQAGDGLTNYEEYRGFHVQGAWTEGDPHRKDFFVRNEAGGMADGGIRLFEQISKLRVHRLAAGELPTSRVVNAARTSGPNKVQQHAVVIRHDPQLGNVCRAVTDTLTPGMPRHASHIGLGNMPNVSVATVNFATGQTQAVSYAASTIAHELFHCCNVYHHGDPPSEKTARVWTKHPDGSITENGTPIRVVSESGADLSGQLAFPGPGGTLTISVYTKGGVASGDVSCVMRYDDGWALEDPARPGVRVLLALDPMQTGEVTGSGLCSGVAANPRFGPATRGNCAGQIVVNDAATRTAR